ncbi:MAG: hypothetical protein RIM83_02040 [Allomuricauda sp.]
MSHLKVQGGSPDQSKSLELFRLHELDKALFEQIVHSIVTEHGNQFKGKLWFSPRIWQPK